MINEGGNVTAVSKTGEETKAEKIPLKKIGRKKFYNFIVKLLKQINKDFKNLYDTNLWTDESIIESGFVFNGSTSFIMDPNIPDEEVIKYKEFAGDLDIAVPEYTKENLFNYLSSIDGKEVIKGARYMGSNKPTVSSIGEQINSVFVLDFDGLKVPAQIDWEFLSFSETGIPTEWSKFCYSSSFDDCKAGVKAVHHKYLLRAIASGISVRDDIVICTDSSTFNNVVLSKNKAHQNPRLLKFSVVRGLRVAYEPLLDPDGNPVYKDNKQVFKALPTSDSTFVTDVLEMFKLSLRPYEDIEGESKKFWSFMGLLELLEKYSNKKDIERIHDRYLELLWGVRPQRAQELEKNNPELDYKVKIGGYLKFIEKFGLPNKSVDVVTEYYNDYGKRGVSESFKTYIESLNIL